MGLALVMLAACSSGDATLTPAATTTSTSPSTTIATTTTTTPRPAPPTGLTDVRDLEPSIVVELKALTGENVTGGPLPGYEANRAFLQPRGAEALARVQRRLAERNLGLKIYDAYRPYRATQALVAWARANGRGDLVGPYIASVSYHNSGQAVDLTLVERSSGRELDMGSAVDELDARANTANATGVGAQNRATLVEAMHAEGFQNYPGEWWHFNYFVAGAQLLDEPVR